jgi:hypothetical protein
MSSPTVSTTPYLFLKFPLFYCYFSFGKAPISLFGSAHWTLKTVPDRNIPGMRMKYPLKYSRDQNEISIEISQG